VPNASRTAVLVCQGRAAADGRLAPGRFADPVAASLLRPDERGPVDTVRAGTVPAGWAPRVEFETVRASAEVVVPRTVAIDDAIRARPAAQLVVLGAGLDARAFRLAELAGVAVFEVDHPASQQDKRKRAGDLRPVAGSLAYVPADLSRDPLGPALAAAGHRADVPTTWVWEGVIPYLRPAEVTATVAALAALSAPGSTLIANYQTPAVSAATGRLVARAMTRLARRPSPWRDEPRRSAWTPGALRGLLERHGLTPGTDTDLLALATDLGTPTRQRLSLRNGRVAVATF
jgi:methyltransferase (TIGR00027 family)